MLSVEKLNFCTLDIKVAVCIIFVLKCFITLLAFKNIRYIKVVRLHIFTENES